MANMNSGKLFEKEIKDSMPNNVLLERFNDGSSSWGGNDSVRFQCTSPSDYFMFNGNILYYLELKSTKGKSLSLSRIKQHQIDDLTERTKYKNVKCGFLVKFSDLAECYYMAIDELMRFIDYNDRKSIPIEHFRNKCLNIPMQLKRVNYKYDLKGLLK